VRGFADITLLLLQHGAAAGSVDNTGRTPLHFTARSGDLESAQHLLDFGAPLAAHDSSGRSVLHDAANRGSEALLALLLQRAKHPADVSLHADRNGMAPLQCAAHRGHEAAVKALLPAVLQVPAVVARATLQAAVSAAVRSEYLQVACLLLKELGQKDPGSVFGVVAELCGDANHAGDEAGANIIGGGGGFGVGAAGDHAGAVGGDEDGAAAAAAAAVGVAVGVDAAAAAAAAGLDGVAAGFDAVGVDVGEGDNAGAGALVSALVLQWVADCANMPQQQQQLQRDQEKLDSERRRMQGLCLAVANLMCELHEPEA
jgi:hypothetical protein